MAKAKKYGTLIPGLDDVWTRTLSKKHKYFPIPVSKNIEEAYTYIINKYKNDPNYGAHIMVHISSYQEIIPNNTIMEHLTINFSMFRIPVTTDLRYDVYKDIKEKCGLFSIPSNHACEYYLHDKESHGKYSNYPDGVISIIKFTF